MPNLTKAQRAAKAAAADSAASAQIGSADQTKTGDSGTANDTASAQSGVGLGANTATASDAAKDAADTAALVASSAALVTEVPLAAINTAVTPAEPDAPTAGPAIGFPLRARVRNNTRMPVQVPALHLDLPASGEATITIYSEGDFRTLHSDLTALFSLNGFGEDAFAVSPAETTEA